MNFNNMITAKAYIHFLCLMFVNGDRLRQLERKMFAMQTMTFQDIGMLRESVDRNFEELQRLAKVINASLSQNTHLHNPVSTSPPVREEESGSIETHLESEVKRLKRGFKDQKLFFHSWKEDIGTKIEDLNKGIDEQSNEIAGKVSETRDAVTSVFSLTRSSSYDVKSMKEALDLIADNVTDIKSRALFNTIKLDELSEKIIVINEKVISSLNQVRNDLNKSSTGKEVINTCSEAVRNSEKMMSLLSTSGAFKEARLVDGSSSSGRLEVFVDGEWGTVCDDEFGKNEANVACKMLGFNGAKNFRTNSYYGQGSGPILFDNVKCNGDEKSLFSCEIDYDTSDCQHTEDVGVVCEE